MNVVVLATLNHLHAKGFRKARVQRMWHIHFQDPYKFISLILLWFELRKLKSHLQPNKCGHIVSLTYKIGRSTTGFWRAIIPLFPFSPSVLLNNSDLRKFVKEMTAIYSTTVIVSRNISIAVKQNTTDSDTVCVLVLNYEHRTGKFLLNVIIIDCTTVSINLSKFEVM